MRLLHNIGNKGYATSIINYFFKYIKEELKDYDFAISMNACAFGMDNTMLHQHDLVAFYEKCGFKVYFDQGGNSMMSIVDTKKIVPYMPDNMNTISISDPIKC